MASTNDKRIGLVEANQELAIPIDDGTREDFAKDPLTDEQAADEGVAIEDQTIDELFAEFDESLMDDLLAV